MSFSFGIPKNAQNKEGAYAYLNQVLAPPAQKAAAEGIYYAPVVADAKISDQLERTIGFIGQGGTIPLMSMLQQGFPKAQMMVCGVLGPKSNAHGPNEFLHVPYGKRLTAAVASVIAAQP